MSLKVTNKKSVKAGAVLRGKKASGFLSSFISPSMSRPNRKTEEFYHSVYDSIDDAIMTLEPPDWLFTTGNPAAVKLFGVKNEAEFVALSPWELSPEFQPDGQLSGDKAKKMISLALKKGQHSFEWVHKKYQGKEFYALVSLSLISINNHRLLRATVRDIGAEKLIESQLKQSQDQYRNLIDNLPDAVYSVDNNGIIRYISPAIKAISGYSSNDLVGVSYLAKVHPDDLPMMKEMFEGVIAGGQPRSVDWRALTKSGRYKWVRSTDRVEKENGRIAGITGVLSDISSLKETELQLKEKISELEKINKLMIGRELKMVELKNEINTLKNQ